MSTEAIIFLIIGWSIVLFLTIWPMKKILSKKISYNNETKENS